MVKFRIKWRQKQRIFKGEINERHSLKFPARNVKEQRKQEKLEAFLNVLLGGSRVPVGY